MASVASCLRMAALTLMLLKMQETWSRRTSSPIHMSVTRRWTRSSSTPVRRRRTFSSFPTCGISRTVARGCKNAARSTTSSVLRRLNLVRFRPATSAGVVLSVLCLATRIVVSRTMSARRMRPAMVGSARNSLAHQRG